MALAADAPSPAGLVRRDAASVLKLGLPLVGSHLAQFAVHVVDTVMLGWYHIDALAAVVLAGAYWFTLFIVGSGFGWAVMPVIAAAAASGDERDVRRVTRMAIWLSLAYTAAVLPLALLAGPAFRALGQPEALARDAAAYLAIAGWGLFPALLVMVLKNYLAALHRTQVVLWTTVAAAILNGILNYALIFGHWGAPELGIRGAAIASVTLHLASAAVLAAYAIRVLPQHALFRRFWRPDWPAFVRIFRLGWPIGLTNLAEVGLFSAAALMMGWLGTVPLAAHGIAIQIASATFLVHLGLSNAATIRAGAASGQGDRAGLRRGAAVALGLSLGFALVTILVFVTVPEPLVGLFLDPGDPRRPEVLALGVTLVALAAVFQLGDAGQVMALGLLRGIQDTRAPMLIAAFSYWVVGMPLGYVLGFPLGHGAVGLWIGLVIGLFVAAGLLHLRFWRRV